VSSSKDAVWTYIRAMRSSTLRRSGSCVVSAAAGSRYEECKNIVKYTMGTILPRTITCIEISRTIYILDGGNATCPGWSPGPPVPPDPRTGASKLYTSTCSLLTRYDPQDV
jgi:hypothetical protein